MSLVSGRPGNGSPGMQTIVSIHEELYVACGDYWVNVGLSHDKVTVRRGCTLQELEDAVLAQYSGVPLARAGFAFARARKGRQLEPFHGDTVNDLEVFLGKGKLVILPKRDLEMPSPQPHDEVNVTTCTSAQCCSYAEV